MSSRSAYFKRRALSLLTGYGVDGEQRLARHINKLDLGRFPSENSNKAYTGQDARIIRESPGCPSPLVRLDEPEVLAFFYSKGGVGKTTICANVGVALAMSGYKVLMIDVDPQASLSLLFDIDVDQDILTIGDAIEGLLIGRNVDLGAAIQYPIQALDLGLIPADQRLVRTDMMMVQAQYREQLFTKVLRRYKDDISQFDFILIDTPPSVSSLSFSAVASSDRIIAVVELANMAVKASGNLFALVAELEEGSGKRLPITFIPNMLHGGKQYTRETLEAIRASVAGISDVSVTSTVIPEYIGLARQKYLGGQRTLMEQQPTSPVGIKMIELAQEIEAIAVIDHGEK
ncbi:ParA family protein [Candidatus Igneacidithiobacillus taiwanensis]|uniref:ParA family protein n=1 Tax=Candidatus Igneacidithiobacillus taiwanensis TaxID=1945924 RepID=UPI002896CBC7|nr:ParA family protein [Candidatus Igneacidithiobacillus taiwanensis]